MAKTFSPFGDVDFTKLMAEFRMPGVDVEAVVNAYRKNIEAITMASSVAVEGMQAVIKRHAEILRRSMEEYARIVREFSTPGSAEEATAKQAELAKHTFETTLAHMREIGEMITKANNESLEVLNKRVSQMLEEVKALSAKTAAKAEKRSAA